MARLRSRLPWVLWPEQEDLIIPSHFTFYDMIVTKARGKSGPLFNFDVHDDVRMTNDRCPLAGTQATEPRSQPHDSHAAALARSICPPLQLPAGSRCTSVRPLEFCGWRRASLWEPV